VNAPCAYCGAVFHKVKASRRFCSKRCAGLRQNARYREAGEHLARYWSNVDRSGEDECWPWLAGTVEGYGQVRFDGEKLGSHVVSFRLQYGAVPSGKMVLHACGNRLCCNPAHLYPGTHADNTNDAIRHGTYRTVFVPGHPSFRRTA
jgi:hypothetical protein